MPTSFNSKTIIGTELDVYFPTLRLAVELNGIFHYNPIYGTDKLIRIQQNDKQKEIRCHELGIEMIVIDTSKCTKQSQYEAYYGIVRDLVLAVTIRHSS